MPGAKSSQIVYKKYLEIHNLLKFRPAQAKRAEFLNNSIQNCKQIVNSKWKNKNKNGAGKSFQPQDFTSA